MKILVDEMPLWYDECLFCKVRFEGPPYCSFTNHICLLHKEEDCKFLVARIEPKREK